MNKTNSNRMLLADGVEYSLDCYATQRNNNVLIVGTSGSGKTRSIVTPNLLEATGSYIVTDPKGNLYKKYGDYLRNKGYIVRNLDFTDPDHSEAQYNCFEYLHTTLDVVNLASTLARCNHPGKYATSEPFWDEATQLLLQSMIAFLKSRFRDDDRNVASILKLVQTAAPSIDANPSVLDKIFEDCPKTEMGNFAIKSYQLFKKCADKTFQSILITTSAALSIFAAPDIARMTAVDTMDIEDIGQHKTAVFVTVSDMERALDPLVNIFFSQAMSILCRYADNKTKDFRLPVPVRFIMDDFATNCMVDNIPRAIASIRSREISVMLMIQAEAQLEAGYGKDARTIISNCDTYVYLGGNDYDTAEAVARRCNQPIHKILDLPVGMNWILRRGEAPRLNHNYNLEQRLAEMDPKEFTLRNHTRRGRRIDSREESEKIA